MLLGAIADDFTGATDLASMLVVRGMRTVQTIGLPRTVPAGNPDAVVVALKSRTISAADAVRQSLDALAWLRAQGARQIYFKVCSTFDSTDVGNIGPVADALLDALGARFSAVCPALPANRRTVYLGHLFVGDALLADSPMRDHPLTPMRDSNLVRVLARQSRRKVGLVRWPVVRAGAASIRAAFVRLEAEGVAHAIVDAIDDSDLDAIGEACADLPLITAGSGVALGLPANFRRAGLIGANVDAATLPAVAGKAAVLAGSCSEMTRRQVAAFARVHPAVAIDPLRHATPDALAEEVLAAVAPALEASRPFLVHSSDEPSHVAAVQQALGTEVAAMRIEQTFGLLARALVERGVRRLIVAGGETSGSVVQALGVEALAIGPTIDPGVPWTATLSEPRLLLALKSGNFGAEDFFLRALAMLD